MKRVSLLFAAFLAAACGGSTNTTSDTTPPTDSAPPNAATSTDAPISDPTSTTPSPTSTEDPGPTAATSLEEVKGAVVRIVGTGTFADPSGGFQANVPGSGSGFVIDPSGLVVTNNHVVTGAALLEVYVAGEDTPRNARVLGVSECSDVAVIQMDAGEYDFVEWYGAPVTAGMEVFAAGFPLGDTEYTVLDGIVSKENASGETSWASVDAVIEHSADTLPGSSGGPIVTADGKVVAVNYAGNELGQSFAIGLDVARPVVEQLATGADVDSIGVNGEAFVDGDFSGIWVYSVESGSPADVAGVEAGDLLLSMEAIVLATDGTMADYCDILRSHTPTDTLAIEVYRASTDQVLEGQLNGQALEVVTSFTTEFDEVVADDPGGFVYTDYTTVTDDSNLIEVSVPVQWADRDGRAWQSDLATGVEELIGPALTAAPDVAGFNDTWGTPGVFIGASAMIPTSVEETLDMFSFSDTCTFDGRFSYDDGVYTGLYDVYSDCGGVGSVFFQVIAEPADQTRLIMVQVVALTDADLAAADQVFATFIVGELAG